MILDWNFLDGVITRATSTAVCTSTIRLYKVTSDGRRRANEDCVDERQDVGRLALALARLALAAIRGLVSIIILSRKARD